MLTIDEIKNVSFRKAKIGGYNADDVDAFIDEVIASFEQLKKEKTNLVHKIDRLATRLEEYRADEETVRNALLTSQKMSDACIKEAREKAARIIRDAEEKAQTLLVEANKTTALEKENYLQLQADAVNLRAEIIELYRSHIQSIDDLPTSVDLEKTRKELDEKYPTDPVEDVPVVQSQPEVFEEEETPQIEQPVIQKRPVRQQPVAITAEPEDDTKVAPRRPSKFGHLKFGDNYDVSAE